MSTTSETTHTHTGLHALQFTSPLSFICEPDTGPTYTFGTTSFPPQSPEFYNCRPGHYFNRVSTLNLSDNIMFPHNYNRSVYLILYTSPTTTSNSVYCNRKNAYRRPPTSNLSTTATTIHANWMKASHLIGVLHIQRPFTSFITIL
jgi:hypothetical protein